MDFVLFCTVVVLAYLTLRSLCDQIEMEMIMHWPMVDAMITSCELAVEDTTGSELTPFLHYSYRINGITYSGRVKLRPWKTDGSSRMSVLHYSYKINGITHARTVNLEPWETDHASPHSSAERLKGTNIRVYYDPCFPARSLFWKADLGHVPMVRNSGLFWRLSWLFFW